MKYKLEMTECFFDEEDKNFYEKLGFRFKTISNPWMNPSYQFKVQDGSEIEINTLEELQNFIKKYGEVIVGEYSITIFNTWDA